MTERDRSEREEKKLQEIEFLSNFFFFYSRSKLFKKLRFLIEQKVEKQ